MPADTRSQDVRVVPRPASSNNTGRIMPANSNTRIVTRAPNAASTASRNSAATQAAHTATAQTVNLGLNSERLRALMIQRLRHQGITDERVLAAMQAVPRHAFVDQGLASRAYEDAALPIGYGQTISQPWVVARMIAAVLHERSVQKVLEVGAGCGYQAAVLAHLVKEVYAVERIRGLADGARARLRALRLQVRVAHGDGMLGAAHAAPFDAILVAAAGLRIPEALLQQLAIGARLIAPEGTSTQRLVLMERTGTLSWRRTVLEAVRFVPLRPGTQD